MKHTLFLLFFLISTMTIVSQENEILLFPDGAPGESVKLKQVDDLSGGKVAGCPVMRVSNVSEPTLMFYPAPAYLSADNFATSPELKVDENTPPTILIQTQADTSFIDSSLFYYYALKEANVPVAMHLYPTGGHGYGARNTGHTVNEWPQRVLSWLRDIEIIE